MRRILQLASMRIRMLVRSIRFRLALWFVVILAVVLAAFSGFVYARQAHDLREATLSRLNYKTHQWESYLKYGGREYLDKRRQLLTDGMQDEKRLLQENDILALVGLQGQVVQKVGPVIEADIQKLVSTGMEQRAYNSPFSYRVVEASTGGEIIRKDFLFVVAPISFNGAVIGFFLLGSPVDPDGQLQRLFLTLLLGSLATLGVALAGGYWLADRAMHPVKAITRAAREIGETDLSRRLNLSTQDELGELAGTFDQMLARLQAAFDRQRQFTADASHELRTPLTIVGLEAGRALASRRTAQEYQRALTVIQSENEFMTRLVNDLLTLSRMDAGQAVLNFEGLDLSDVALDVVERLNPLAERSGVVLSTGELPELKVSGDRQYLSQMITNLVENAIKYARRADQKVHVETGRDQDGQGMGWVRVEDNGPGISTDHLPHLFDRFYQVDQARLHEPDELENASPGGQTSAGSGLGLSIVQQIARAHGGDISVESEINRGSVFLVRIPLAGEIQD